jgi:redox-sensitive bicupin YhaK (pirin superfamily)
MLNNIKSKTMKRSNFIKGTILGALGLFTASKIKSNPSELPEGSTYRKLTDPIGFNHLPTKEVKTMKSVLHQANTRGNANHGWLQSHHSFSFANYYNPQRMHFGVLRVLNDDTVAPGRGFSTHPHDNMEIISIPLEGDLEHKDSMGNVAVIKEGDIQVMSAGTGVYHSEYNKNKDQLVKFLQIWLFPNKKNVTPRYDQITLGDEAPDNELIQILSPSKDDAGVWIHQDAWFHIGKFSSSKTINYKVHKSGNGIYTFVLDGQIAVGDQDLNPRDGYGVWDTDSITIHTSPNSRILIMEVPMSIS